ncbi:MAG: MotA/TolQ/ExbB proton channel family protein [Candidatus Omnitrophica bacterium]|nr:MotA/TolQ/ExbB proton channel family protein [Candidatus Omnitrophota bacterium]
MKVKATVTMLMFGGLLVCVLSSWAVAAPASPSPVAGVIPAAPGNPTTTLWQLLKSGGWSMLVLALLSLVALAIIVYDLMSLKPDVKTPQRFFEDLVEKLESGDVKGAQQLCRRSDNILSNVAIAGLERIPKGRVIVREAMENTARKEVSKLWQNVAYLGDIATIAPLMGLLGTVLGMIQAFNVISFAGASLKPIMLVGGISKALVTTAAGLVIAVPVLSVYSYFRGIVQEISNRTEMYCTDVMKLIEESAKH